MSESQLTAVKQRTIKEEMRQGKYIQPQVACRNSITNLAVKHDPDNSNNPGPVPDLKTTYECSDSNSNSTCLH